MSENCNNCEDCNQLASHISELEKELERKQHKIDKGIGLIKKLQDMWQTYKQGFELAKTELATANAALEKIAKFRGGYKYLSDALEINSTITNIATAALEDKKGGNNE